MELISHEREQQLRLILNHHGLIAILVSLQHLTYALAKQSYTNRNAEILHQALSEFLVSSQIDQKRSIHATDDLQNISVRTLCLFLQMVLEAQLNFWCGQKVVTEWLNDLYKIIVNYNRG